MELMRSTRDWPIALNTNSIEVQMSNPDQGGQQGGQEQKPGQQQQQPGQGGQQGDQKPGQQPQQK